MKRKKSPGIDQISTEMIQQEDKHHVLRSMNLHLYLECERIATTSKDCFFFLPWRNGLWWAKASSLSRMHSDTHTHWVWPHHTR